MIASEAALKTLETFQAALKASPNRHARRALIRGSLARPGRLGLRHRMDLLARYTEHRRALEEAR